MKGTSFASSELRAALSGIARELKQAQSARGKRVRRDRPDGYDLEWVPDPPDERGFTTVSFTNVRLDLWRELGAILEKVADGASARHLFGQHLRTNPSKEGEHRLRALAYWSVRAKDPQASDAEAIELARRIVPISKALRADTIRKYAQRHRARCLYLLSLHPNWVCKFKSSDIQIRALGRDIAPLIHHLRKKESREKWRRHPPFENFAEVLLVKVPGLPDKAAFPRMSLYAEELPPGASLNITKRSALLGDIRVRSC
jgi:hypothetical protein